MVFTTKHPPGAPTDPTLTRRQQTTANVYADFGAELHKFNDEDDHIHLLVHHPPTVALSKLVNSLKDVSSRRLRQEHGNHLNRYLRGGHL